MNDRAGQLYARADAQLTELIELASSLDGATLRLPCRGREKLGDGTVGALAQHAADNYQRIATFVNIADRRSGRGGNRLVRFLQSGRHGPGAHRNHGHGPVQDDRRYTAAAVEPNALVEQLSDARQALRRIADLGDGELDAIPPEGSFRFCDGQRTLEQVLTGLLTHQGHQVDAIRATIRS